MHLLRSTVQGQVVMSRPLFLFPILACPILSRESPRRASGTKSEECIEQEDCSRRNSNHGPQAWAADTGRNKQGAFVIGKMRQSVCLNTHFCSWFVQLNVLFGGAMSNLATAGVWLWHNSGRCFYFLLVLHNSVGSINSTYRICTVPIKEGGEYIWRMSGSLNKS